MDLSQIQRDSLHSIQNKDQNAMKLKSETGRKLLEQEPRVVRSKLRKNGGTPGGPTQNMINNSGKPPKCSKTSSNLNHMIN